MFSVKYKSKAVKCPHCTAPIKYKEGRVPGGVNDKGGWKLTCDACSKEFAIQIENPADFSHIVSGAVINDNYDNDVESKETFLADHNLDDFKLEILEYTDEILDAITFNLNSNPIYVATDGENLEKPAYQALEVVLNKKDAHGQNEIERFYKAYFNIYVKGRWGDPKYCYILLEFLSQQNIKRTAFFYFNFSGNGRMPENLNEYLLSEVADCIPYEQLINGIYNRDICKDYLEKFLIRWRGLNANTIIAVPFIGYQNQKLEKREALWDWLKKFIADDNVIFYTRQIAITLLNESRKKKGIPVDILKEFNITETGIDTAVKHNFFHAKFYVGINQVETEILKGSYNLHENNYLENFDFQDLQTNMFIVRYLMPLGIDPTKLNFNSVDALWIDLRNSKSNIEFSNPNGKSLFKKLL
jgi:hypothetical protein